MILVLLFLFYEFTIPDPDGILILQIFKSCFQFFNFGGGNIRILFKIVNRFIDRSVFFYIRITRTLFNDQQGRRIRRLFGEQA